MENQKTNPASINPENPCDTSVCGGGGGNLLTNKTKRPLRAKAHKFFGVLSAFTLLVKALRSNPLTALLRSRRSRFSHTKFRNCVAHSSAFTLAEVLVTLTILGIVASIVVPNLMQQYKKAQTISRLKIAYSMLDNLTQQSYVENGYPPVGAGSSIITVFNDYFRKYLSIAKDCGAATGQAVLKDTGCFKSGNYRNTDGVFVEDKDGNKLERDMYYSLDGEDSVVGAYNPSYYYKVVLKNGMSIGFADNHVVYNGYSIVVDIDGPNKGDSKLGQDVFQFTYYAPNQGIKYTNCQYPGLFKGAYHPYSVKKGTCDVDRQYLLNTCRDDKTATVGFVPNNQPFPNGSGCSGLIIKDGWKISKDYPWDYAQKKIKN